MASNNKAMAAFMPNKAVRYTAVEIPVSDRFCGEDGKPINWRLKVLSAKEMQKLTAECTTRIIRDGHTVTERDEDTMNTRLLEECVLYPNLKDAELQNSYGAAGARELAETMLTPGEYGKLMQAISQAQGVDMGLADQIKKLKN